VSFFSKVAETYRQTSKPHDILWNRFVARPLASVALVPLSATTITPNQITIVSFLIFVVAACLMALWPGWGGGIIAVVVLEVSYVLDCVDGQLARKKGLSSPVGAHLDFVMDELKAFLLVAAVGIRLWQAGNEPLWLLEAVLGLCAVASGIGLTTFIRRPEVMRAMGRAVPESSGDYGEGFATANVRPVHRSPLSYIEGLGKFLIHYPSYLLFMALANRLDIFLHVYIAINAAYAARLLARVFIKLGKTVP
jgi:phosphatidylglycerophosphate synthase